MGNAQVFAARLRLSTLLAAMVLALAALVVLALTEQNQGLPKVKRAPLESPQRAPSTTWFDAYLDAPVSAPRARGPRSDILASLSRGRSASGGGASTTSPGDPDEAAPTAQVDVAVPAAGTQVSAGEGENSCTTVQVSALSPEGCPPPSGEGPAVVQYTGPEPDPNAAPEPAPTATHFA